MATPALLRSLESIKLTFEPGAARAKLAIVRRLGGTSLPSADAVLRFHEVLCFLRAYPDDRRLLAEIERVLERFANRRDLARHRGALANSGIAGTVTRFRFFWETARWLARRWPKHLFLEWEDDEAARRLGEMLPRMISFTERTALKELSLPTRLAIDRLRPAGVSDAVFFIRRVERMPGDSFARETLHDAIDATYRLDPCPGGPSRTRAKFALVPVVFRRRPLPTGRPDLAAEIGRPPGAVRGVGPRDGRRLLDMAHEAMVTRERDLDAFLYGDPRTMLLIDDGDGLQFACVGVVPERRGPLHAVHGYLTLRNGVPIGYAQTDSLAGSSSVAFNVFATFRGGEAAYVFARFLSAVSALFGARSFNIEPYQLGCGNQEGIASGAWWFYYKLGFRPQGAAVRRLVRRELERSKRSPGHRSSRRVLEALAAEHVFFELDPSRESVPPPPWPTGKRAARELALRGGADHATGERECVRAAMRVLGARSTRRISTAERRAWSRLGPIVLSVPGVARWSEERKAAIVRLIRAKGAPSEIPFVRQSDACWFLLRHLQP